jgi:hypothetical protein
MPSYTFELRDGFNPIEDNIGVILTDRADAYQYAQGVVRELMSGREAQTRTWRLDVYENGAHENSAECVFAIPFASLDATLDNFDPEVRAFVELACERSRSVREVISDVRTTVQEARALVARSRGKPYLVTNLGRPTIRDNQRRKSRSSTS